MLRIQCRARQPGAQVARKPPISRGPGTRPTNFGRAASDGDRVRQRSKNDTSPESDEVWTEFVAETLLPTNMGKFRLRGYRHTVDGGKTFSEPSAIISGQVEGKKDVVVRVHDACWTSEVIGSLKCDCREQLHLAMRYIQDQPPGIVIYCQQEGRGIGLANKIAAYALQERGLDTVQANRALGLPDDCREYSAVRHILRELEIESIRLMTNNPRKLSELEALGIVVTGRVPCIVVGNEFNQGYLYVDGHTRTLGVNSARALASFLSSQVACVLTFISASQLAGRQRNRKCRIF
jgi:GTP cyclohydrolase II